MKEMEDPWNGLERNSVMINMGFPPLDQMLICKHDIIQAYDLYTSTPGRENHEARVIVSDRGCGCFWSPLT